MKVFKFDNILQGTGHVFPEIISGKDWIGYHATSSFYSSNIERSGFTQDKIISSNVIDVLIIEGGKLGLNVSSVEGYSNLNSISFCPLSELCLTYTRSQSLGGQGVGYVYSLAKTVLGHKNFDASTNEAGIVSSVVRYIDDVRKMDPVIYAVNLSGLERARYDNLTKAIHVYEPIKPIKIVAKLEVSGFSDHDKINTVSLKNKIDILYRQTGSKHYITKMT